MPAGWDKSDKINKSSLYTEDGEDILLEHRYGMKKFMSLMNKKVRIKGDVVSDDHEGKKVLVKRISKIGKVFCSPESTNKDKFHAADSVNFAA